MLSPTLHLTALLLASTLTPTFAQSPSSFPPHCLPRLDSSPPLDPQSCASALNEFLSSNPPPTNLFTTSPSPSSSAISLPYDRTHMGCRLRIELLYASEVTQSVQDVWAQGVALDTKCVVDGAFVGGSVFVNGEGLVVSLRPEGDGGWEGRFNGSSVVVGGGGEGGGDKGLVEVTAGSGGGGGGGGS